jgi:hypothetical protein
MIIDIGYALKVLAPEAGWSMTNFDYDTIEWHSEDIPKPTKKEVEAKLAELQAEEAAKAQAEADKKQAAEAKLAKLGLTPEDLKALLG